MGNPLKAQCLKFSGSALCELPYGHLGDCDFSSGQDSELGPATDANLTEWMERHRIDPDADNVDPDELGTFGEVLDYWTMRGGMTEDERTAFWQSWTRHTIVWGTVLIGAALVGESFGGIVDLATRVAGAVAIVALVWQVVDAVRFGREGRRWQ